MAFYCTDAFTGGGVPEENHAVGRACGLVSEKKVCQLKKMGGSLSLMALSMTKLVQGHIPAAMLEMMKHTTCDKRQAVHQRRPKHLPKCNFAYLIPQSCHPVYVPRM